MKLRFNTDFFPGSFSHGNTPGLDAVRLPFQTTSCGYYRASDAYFTEREGLESYLLLHTLEGTGYLEWEGRTHILKPGEVITFDCVKHQFYRADGAFWAFQWVHFQGMGAAEYVSRLHRNHPDPVPLRDSVLFNSLFAQLFKLMRDKPLQNDLEASLLITRILTELILSGDKSLASTRNPVHSQDVQHAIACIEARYSEKLSAEDILSPAHISPWYFSRLFKEQTGRSPYEYLIQHRLNMAVNDLMRTELPISEIAWKNGFGDSTQFIRRFRQYYGTTPATFRKNVT